MSVPIRSQKKMIERKAENIPRLAFNEQCENELLFTAATSRKTLFVKTPFRRTEDMILIDIIQHSIGLQ